MKFIFSSFIVTLALAASSLAVGPTACSITGDGSRCRRSPSLSADIIGQFAINKKPTFKCFDLGDSVDGIIVWDKTEINGVACFVSDTLVGLPCPTALPQC